MHNDARSRVVLVALAALAACEQPAPEPNGANVVLVSLDSLRRDLLGVYGHSPTFAPGHSPSPRLDALAHEGVLFRAACATTSWTLPAHVSLLTGEPELVHGVEGDADAIDPGLVTLAERLREAGYRTAGFYSGPYLSPRHGFARGFELYEAAYGPGLAQALQDARDEEQLGGDVVAAGMRVELESHRDVSSKRVTELGLKELEQAARDERPFFLFLHYFDPHYDYIAPPPFDDKFDPLYEGQVTGRDFIRDPAVATFDPARPSGRVRVASDRDMAHVRALYSGELAWIDSQIGRLLDALTAWGLEDDTLFVVTADHGDEFFEHDGLGHRRTLFEEVVAVPLILRLPQEQLAGSVVEQPVPVYDVFATVLDGLNLMPQSAASRSLLELVPTDGGAAARAGFLGRLVERLPLRIVVPTESGRVPLDGEKIVVHESWREGSIKLLRKREWTRARQELPAGPVLDAIERQSQELFEAEELYWFDLEETPRERDRERRQDFDDPRARAALEAFRRGYAELSSRRRAGVPAEGDAVLDHSLRGLGYVGGGSDARAVYERLVLPLPGEAR